MHLIFVNRFYWPETPATGQLLTDLAESLAQRGDDVTVITSHSGLREQPAAETRAGVLILRLRSTRWNHAGIVGKAVDFATFYLGAMWQLWRVARRDSIVIAMTDPPLLGIGAWLATRLRGARLIHWIQDIYPELALELTGHSWLRVLRPLRNLAWRRADDCITLGTDMAGVLTSVGVEAAKAGVIPNWAPRGSAAASPEDVSALRLAWGVAEKFVVAYSGNLGRVHDLEPVLAVAAALQDDPAIAFVFVGGGAQRDPLKATAIRQGLKNVQFQPSQPRERLGATLRSIDLHLVTLLPGCERFVFPSKLYGVASAGRPVLFIGPGHCEVARLVVEQKLGIARSRDDIAGLTAHIRHLAHSPAESQPFATAAILFAAENSFEVAVERWSDRLAAVHACPATATADTKLAAR